MATVSAKEFFGGAPATVVGNETSPEYKKSVTPSYTERVGNAMGAGADVAAQSFAGAGQNIIHAFKDYWEKPKGNLLEDVSNAAVALSHTAGNIAGGTIGAALGTAKAAVAPFSQIQTPEGDTIGQRFGEPIKRTTEAIPGAIDKAATSVSNALPPKLKEASIALGDALMPYAEDKNLQETFKDFINTSGLLGGGKILGAPVSGVTDTLGAFKSAGADIAGGVGDAAASIKNIGTGGAGAYAKSAVRDVIPTIQNTINHQVSKALDLTPGDLNNIFRSTGNDVGQWLSDNNLIGSNKANTQTLINDFYKKNYADVRTAIEQVSKVYKPYQIPRYTDALKQIYNKITGIPGLEKTAAEVDNLLHKTDIELADVQRVKELMDEHFNLYKVTGDVSEGVAKEGLANIRSDLKGFIEKEVKDATGEDISAMNGNVSTARSLDEAVTTRSQRGLTRANLSTRDLMMGLGLTYFGSPLLGAAAVLIKKIATSPTVRLRFARYLDSLSDARKAKISEALNKGEVPPEVTKVVESPDYQSTTEKNAISSAPSSDFIEGKPTTPIPKDKGGGPSTPYPREDGNLIGKTVQYKGIFGTKTAKVIGKSKYDPKGSVIIQPEKGEPRIIKVSKIVSEGEVGAPNTFKNEGIFAKLIGKGEFGPIYEGVKGQDAVDHLLSVKNGEVQGAFHRVDLGDIDLIWGDETGGLAHFKNRTGALKNLTEVVENGELKTVGRNTMLVSKKVFGSKGRAYVRLDWKGTPKRWVITSY